MNVHVVIELMRDNEANPTVEVFTQKKEADYIADGLREENADEDHEGNFLVVQQEVQLKTSGLETPLMLVLSTTHVTHRTSLILDGKRPGPKPLLFPKGEYGWFIPIIPFEPDDAEDRARWSLPDLMAIRSLADEMGCTWIMLDRDADVIEDLPTYEW